MRRRRRPRHPRTPGTNETAGARRIAAAFARARAEGRAALIPYIVAGYPDADTSLAAALAAADAGADLLEVGLPYSDPLADGATLQRASGVALAAGATLERSLRLIERIGAARPDLPLVPMGYANQVIGGGDGEAVATATRRRGGGRADRRGPDAGRRGAVRGGGPCRRARGRLSRGADHATRQARRRRRPERRLPVLRVARRRDRRPDVPAGVGRDAWSRTSRRSRPSRWPSGSVSASRPTSGRSPRPGRTGSSSPRLSSTRSAPTAGISAALGRLVTDLRRAT